MKFAADNIQITNIIVEKALSAMNPAPIHDIVLQCEKAGADFIDINTGPLNKKPIEKMIFFIEAIQDVTELPLIIDTANPIAIEAGLKTCREKVIINGFSLEPQKINKILPLAKEYDAEIIGYLLNPDSSVPKNSSERMDIAVSLYEETLKAGVNPEKLIIDPVLVPLLWADGTAQAMEVLDVIKILPELLGFPVKTIIGLSNLTSGKGPADKKNLMEKSYAALLAAAGVSIVLLNILHHDTIKTAKAASILSNREIITWEEL